MRSGTLRAWTFVHRWSSLVCTLFMLLLCVTGLPLIFSHEINHMMLPARPALSTDIRPAVEQIVERAAQARPGERVNYAYFDEDDPFVLVATAPSADALPDDTHYQLFDLRDGSGSTPDSRRKGSCTSSPSCTWICSPA